MKKFTFKNVSDNKINEAEQAVKYKLNAK